VAEKLRAVTGQDMMSDMQNGERGPETPRHRIGEKILAAADALITPRQGGPAGPPGVPEPPGGRKTWVRRHPFITGLGIAGFLAVIFAIALSAGHGTGSQQPPSAQTVTFVVNGDPARVSYGPAGSQLQGSVPMNVTQPLGNPIYYAISAQLQGDGSVTCEIDVNGQAVSGSTATASYGLATCEISPDGSGGWENTNASG